ncbi:MAG: DUF3592 domain-containing protein [Mariniblastus sp.]|nr:DUF3592 domain-containing protein [Mariniblastus sp.]
MKNRSKTNGDKELAEGRSQRHALLFIWGVIATIGLLLTLYGQYQLSWARASADWPVVPGRIVTSEVTTHTDEEGTTYSDEIEYAYTVDGTEYEAGVVVIGGHSYGAHNVVARYPLNADVSVAYDPNKPSRAVLEPGVESYEWQTFGISMILGALFMATLFNFILRRAMNEEKSILDHTLIILFKTVAFPISVCNGNLWVLGGMVGLAVWLSTLEIHPVLTYGSAIFGALYGVIWVLMLWIWFMAWLYELRDRAMERHAAKLKSQSKREDTE